VVGLVEYSLLIPTGCQFWGAHLHFFEGLKVTGGGVLVPNSTMLGTNTLSKISRRCVSSVAAPAAGTEATSGWYHSVQGGNGKWGMPNKTSVNLRQVEMIALHHKEIRFYTPKSNFWKEHPFYYKYFATHEAAEAAYTALTKQVDALR